MIQAVRELELLTLREARMTKIEALKELLEGKAPASDPGEVYFIQAGDGGPVKIGHTLKTTVRRRLETLQTAHHLELRLLLAVTGSVVDEQRLHRDFAALRIRGEWFRFEEPLVSFIASGGNP